MTAATADHVNYWYDKKCAKAFWSQCELPAYRWLLNDTVAWIDPKPGERWLDLGCGGGQLTKAIWHKSGGQVAQVVAIDVAAANEKRIAELRQQLIPAATEHEVAFRCADFSNGLDGFSDGSFDGAVSGLAMQYAQSWSAEKGCWTTDAYDRLLRDLRRVLRPGGALVFSVNVPNPSWALIGLTGLSSFFVARRPLVYMKNCLRMGQYGAWLKREARAGRFHYLPADAVLQKLRAAGFDRIEHRLSFARQAFVFRAHRPD